jgi:hypothetical protein
LPAPKERILGAINEFISIGASDRPYGRNSTGPEARRPGSAADYFLGMSYRADSPEWAYGMLRLEQAGRQGEVFRQLVLEGIIE